MFHTVIRKSRHLGNYVIFNFKWSDPQWIRKNPHVSSIYEERYRLNPLPHESRVKRFLHRDLEFQNVGPIQLMTFDEYFFKNKISPLNQEDIDIETEYSNKLAYK